MQKVTSDTEIGIQNMYFSGEKKSAIIKKLFSWLGNSQNHDFY
jgi:hypothetical protein